MNNNLVNENTKKMVERARKNSCVSERIPVYGEVYVSKKTKKKKQKSPDLVTLFKIGAAMVVTGATIGAGVYASSTMDFATEVRQEVNDTYMDQNLIGGQFIEKNEHNSEFREYVSDLSDFELSRLYNDTSKEMYDNGMVQDSSNLEEVVDQMEENYLESSSKGSK